MSSRLPVRRLAVWSVGLKIPAVAGLFVGVFCIWDGAMVGLLLRPSQVGSSGGDWRMWASVSIRADVCRRGLGTGTTKRRLHTRTCTTGSPGRHPLRRTGSPPISSVPRVERRHGGLEIVAEESAMISRPEEGRWRQRCRELHHGDDADDGRMISTGGNMTTRRHVRGRLSEFISVCRVPRARIEAGLGSKRRPREGMLPCSIPTSVQVLVRPSHPLWASKSATSSESASSSLTLNG